MECSTVVRDIFARLKFRDFEENLTSIKICDFYFRGHMLHEARLASWLYVFII